MTDRKGVLPPTARLGHWLDRRSLLSNNGFHLTRFARR
jgi:hypothetical protein